MKKFLALFRRKQKVAPPVENRVWGGTLEPKKSRHNVGLTPAEHAEYERQWSLVPPHGNVMPAVPPNPEPLELRVEVDE